MKKIIIYFMLFIMMIININALDIDNLNDNTILFYNLNLNAEDLTSNSYDGFINGSSISYNNGIIGNAYLFDGVNDRIEVPAISLLESSSQYTFNFWFKPYIVNEVSNIIDFGYHTRILFQQQGTGTINYQVRDSIPSWKIIVSNSTFIDNTWYNVFLIWNGTYMSLYIDNVFNGQVALNSLQLSNTGQNHIGNDLASSSYFYGLIDEFLILNKSVNSDERRFIYESGINKTLTFPMYIYSDEFDLIHLLPENNTNILTKNFTNYYQIEANYNVTNINCSLYINSTLNQTSNLVELNSILSFNTEFFNNGNYEYYVYCISPLENQTTSKRNFIMLYDFTIPEESEESTTSTDFTLLANTFNIFMMIFIWFAILGISFIVENNTILFLGALYGFLLSVALVVAHGEVLYSLVGIISSYLLYLSYEDFKR